MPGPERDLESQEQGEEEDNGIGEIQWRVMGLCLVLLLCSSILASTVDKHELMTLNKWMNP